ncbi:hypothetical protein Hanom_Chr15g01398701 [Helianthus anomalus]
MCPLWLSSPPSLAGSANDVCVCVCVCVKMLNSLIKPSDINRIKGLKEHPLISSFADVCVPCEATATCC